MRCPKNKTCPKQPCHAIARTSGGKALCAICDKPVKDKAPGRPSSYREHNGCWNCERAFEMYSYDGGVEYYCRKGAPKRPLCGSGAMGESFVTGARWNRHDQLYDAWEEWRAGREVEPWGRCLCHKTKGQNSKHPVDRVP